MNVREMREFHRILKEEYQRGYRDGQQHEIHTQQYQETIDQLDVAEKELEDLQNEKIQDAITGVATNRSGRSETSSVFSPDKSKVSDTGMDRS